MNSLCSTPSVDKRGLVRTGLIYLGLGRDEDYKVTVEDPGDRLGGGWAVVPIVGLVLTMGCWLSAIRQVAGGSGFRNDLAGSILLCAALVAVAVVRAHTKERAEELAAEKAAEQG